ncbi:MULTISPECIES: sulfur carrier protein ThiS [Paenibacillus]|uniref:sulfur carrier protein ThiS n=1 Tax=Paenibacillus TaxID=44249 RepID=UPI00083972AF|nr:MULTISPECIES: sulfur carrier protein ThiS [Paenibacillus]GIP19912.1 thiamine biosynthesis protein ThiS [Paenibacillus sp. J22TS3]
MKIRINGQIMTLDQEIRTVHDLLESLDLGVKTVVVEQNHDILHQDQHEEALLSDGDSIEIVHFVGGG